MTDKVVDMAVINKVTQLTDAVKTLQEQYGRLEDEICKLIRQYYTLRKRTICGCDDCEPSDAEWNLINKEPRIRILEDPE
jgi:hypothetical protein